MSDKEKLIQEMNDLSDYTGLTEEEKQKHKARMIEIAKMLLAEHYSGKKNPPKEKNGL